MAVECPKCGTENPSDSKYCKECSAPLPQSEVISAQTKTIVTPIPKLAKGISFAGRYEIIEELGRGGMGVVYKAHDTKLKRTVALKFLPPELTHISEVKERFMREAQAAASLDHPNICTVYEFDENEDKSFISMAYIEGQSLMKKIKSGPLELDDALRIATQAAEGLQEAHKKGVVHRDIKSANILMDQRGQPKIMDFGLARVAGGTLLTKEGTTMGTIAYMSPEQARGEEIDQRSDIWSLGVVFYELITGQLPFKGDFEQAVIYLIMNEDPEPLTGLRSGVPMELERIVNKALAKDTGERYQYIDEMLMDLRLLRKELEAEATKTKLTQSGTVVGTAAFERPKESAKPHEMQRPAGTRSKLGWIIGGGCLFVALTMALFVLFRGDDAELPLRKWLLPLKKSGPMQWEFPVKGGLAAPAPNHHLDAAPVISPDGKRVAFVQDNRLCIHDLDQVEARDIPDSEGASLPFWSPQSDFVGYGVPTSSGWTLNKVSIHGGSSISLCTLSGYDGAFWGDDGLITVSQWTKGVWAVPARGGEPRKLVSRDLTRGELGITKPLVLPDRQSLAFSCMKTNGTCDLYIQAGDTRKLLVPSPLGGHLANPVYSSTGHLLYISFSAYHIDIWAVPFSLESGTTTGEPFLVAENATWPSLSTDGTLVYQRFQFAPDQLVLVDRSGHITGAIGGSHVGIRQPTFSPDGSRVAVRLWENHNFDIWIYDVVRGTRTRLTSDPDIDEEPAWSPRGDRLAFASYRNGQSELFIKAAGGSGDAQMLVHGDYPDWSPDGNCLVYQVRDLQTNNRDLWYLSLTAEGVPQPFHVTDAHEGDPRFSPDGRYVAYTSNQTGRTEVYVKSFPDGADMWQVSVNRGVGPRWSSRGDELFFVEGNALMVVPVKTRPRFQMGKPQRLFAGDQATPPLLVGQYDVTSDGQQFVIMQDHTNEKSTGLTVVQNWYAEFKERVR